MNVPFDHYAFLAPFHVICRDCFVPMKLQHGELKDHGPGEQPEVHYDCFCDNPGCVSWGTQFKVEVPIGAVRLTKKNLVLV